MYKERFLELDGIRGVAAIGVVLFHYFFRFDNIYGHDGLSTYLFYYGQFGVELFFMVSGFVIFWTLNRVSQPLDFVVSRVSRLYPVYWLSVIITFTIVTIFTLPGREVDFTEAIFNILMFHEYLNFSHVDGVYWTLTVELTFYFWMFFIYLGLGFKYIEKIFSLLIFLSVIHSLNVISIPSPIYKIFILKYIPFFFAGICFYKTFSEGGSMRLFTYLSLTLISTIFIYSVSCFLIFLTFFILFYGALSGYLRFLSIKPLVFLGSISYSLYLIHQNIGYVVINKFYEMQLNPLLGIFFAIVISLVLATLLSKFVEIPVMRLVRKKYKESEKIQKIAKDLTFFKRS